MRHRLGAGLFFVAVTLFFAVGLRNVELKTIFSDLLPEDDPFVQVYKDHPGFGSPLTISVMVKRKDGQDIYNAETLRKVWNLTRDIDLTLGVDHDKILSITTTKARYAEATPAGIESQPLMGDHVPQTGDEIAEFRRRVDKAPGARGFLISKDHTATIIEATFIERILDYGAAFRHVQKLVELARDEHHNVYLAGQPALTGWVYQLESQMFGIFAVTLGLLVLALALYMRNIVGVVTPIVTSLVAAIWGFGLTGWLKSPIEPLLMIVPLLLVARSFSHCVQFTERYYEIYAHVRDKVKAAEITMGCMMAPSVLGIFTDIVGIFVIAIAPIPAMDRFALFCGWWAVWLIPTGVVLISLLLATLPAPRNVERLVSSRSSAFQRRFQAFLAGIARLTFGRPALLTAAVVAVGGIFAVYTALQIKIGNPVEGSNLLWDDSEYNEAVRQINKHFPGVNTLEIVLESRHPDDNTRRTAQQAHTAQTMAMLQVLMESGDAPPTATRSYNDYMMGANSLFQGGNTKWLPIDPDDRHVQGASRAALTGGSPKDFSQVVDFQIQNSTVSFWYPDNKQETVDAALAAAGRAVALVGTEHDDFIVRLATGTIPLQQAMNHVVERYHWIIIGLLNFMILLGCSYAYRSLLAGLLLLIPVNLTNFALQATMHLLGIGLDINSLMVAAIGVGVGIDYGIYLLSRICEEYHANDGDWGLAITASLTTTGKAIMFTAVIMLAGIIPWYFLSGLKFMADMGLMLAMIMLINMIMSLVVLPLLVWLLKPSFVGRKDLYIGEGVDLSAYTAADGGPAARAQTKPSESQPASGQISRAAPGASVSRDAMSPAE
ncbi:hypothetical protein SAMN04488038_11642 [Solimonas aquatica]|uniref:Membrane transport protein MMPL domain-containing protein n=2 Tax=Solimonas aquatica TaxID=489703 RepID=A0A1H9LIP3_9GAMM|nr:hypothetical protein SAMN04488038_11642 [Solimonas aquatica]